MNRGQNKLLDDIANICNQAAKTVETFKEETQNIAQSQIENLINKLNLVNREQLEIVKQMVQKIQLEQQDMKIKIEEIEKKLQNLTD
ncbi:accessory factor UbiK family protein [Bartonella sp. DGB1]|uniref:accessory factor UbiK family protein n=1 Tax=Bartonella sp. DGB1 TaxID=3239807 RepID=UPI00352315B0